MSNKNKNSGKLSGQPENPFQVPTGYFEQLGDRVMERIRAEEQLPGTKNTGLKKRMLHPYFAVAASLAGVALVVYILLQSVPGNRGNEQAYYDLETLEQIGIFQDEAILSETYNNNIEESFTDWEEETMLYLSSNEVDLYYLLESN